MALQWDELKRLLNSAKHGVDFEDITPFFEGPVLIRYDHRDSYGEDRWMGTGHVDGVTLFVVYTERDHDQIRIISARRATKHEEKQYYRHFGRPDFFAG